MALEGETRGLSVWRARGITTDHCRLAKMHMHHNIRRTSSSEESKQVLADRLDAGELATRDERRTLTEAPIR